MNLISYKSKKFKMAEKTDLQSEITLTRAVFQKKREKFYKNYEDGGIDLSQLNQYSNIFSEGIKEGSVRFEPHENGTGSLFIDTVNAGEKETKELTIDNIDEAAFFLGLQLTIKPTEEK